MRGREGSLDECARLLDEPMRGLRVVQVGTGTLDGQPVLDIRLDNGRSLLIGQPAFAALTKEKAPPDFDPSPNQEHVIKFGESRVILVGAVGAQGSAGKVTIDALPGCALEAKCETCAGGVIIGIRAARGGGA